MKTTLRRFTVSAIIFISAFFILTASLRAAELPHVRLQNGASQLIVNGQPFLILGGELGNSSSGAAAQADCHHSPAGEHARQHQS